MNGPLTLAIIALISLCLTVAFLLTEAGYDERRRDRADAAAMRREQAKRAALRVRR